MIYSHRKTVTAFDLETVNREIEEFCEQNQVPAGKLFAIQLIIEELVTNIIKYGSKNRKETIAIEIAVAADVVKLTISDNATAFNPLEQGTPDTGLSVEERSVGGLGLFLVRNKVKSLSYENVNGFNVLRAEI